MNSSFIKNEVWNQGGAVFLDNTDIEFFGCIFFSNKAQVGGGVFLKTSGDLFLNFLI